MYLGRSGQSYVEQQLESVNCTEGWIIESLLFCLTNADEVLCKIVMKCLNSN
jgi:hypothetical protein